MKVKTEGGQNELLQYDMDSDEMRKLMGERFLQIRRNILKLSQAKMGEKIGVSLDRLYDFESGKRTTDPAIVYKILIYLMNRNVDVNLLFEDEFSVEAVRRSIEGRFKYHFNMEII